MNRFNQNKTEGNDTWFTPPEIVSSLGNFDLDPCTHKQRPWDTAKKHFTLEDDGLAQPWEGRVWMNPPYGRVIEAWMKKLSEHRNGTALIFSRTDTVMFQRFVFETAYSVLFIEKRLSFYDLQGKQAPHNSGAPSVLIAYNEENSEFIEASGILGKHLPMFPTPMLIGFDTTNQTWKMVINNSIKDLGGRTTLRRLYLKVMTDYPVKIRKNKNFKAKVRQTLYKYFERTNDDWKTTIN